MACDSLLMDKPVASCQQTCCKLIVQTRHSQACCKLFQQVVTSLQMTSCNKPDFNRLVAMQAKVVYEFSQFSCPAQKRSCESIKVVSALASPTKRKQELHIHLQTFHMTYSMACNLCR